MRDIAIYGCGGFGREVLQILHALNAQAPEWRFLGFVVDPGFEHPEKVHGFPVKEDVKDIALGEEVNVAIGIGAPAARRRIAERLGAQGYTFPTLVHPGAWIGENVTLEDGALICAGACLTTDIRIAEHVHLNLGATVGHDAVIGAFSTISPGANISGNVLIGERVEIGTGASIVPGITIGMDTIIGAGAAVVRSIPAQCTAVGVPARIIKSAANES